jgi:16S rRNA (guanine1516-N2)-methyltransferase
VGVIIAARDPAPAQRLAERLDLPILKDAPAGALAVVARDAGFELSSSGVAGRSGVRVAFDDPALRHRRRAGHNELLGRAVGWRAHRSPRVLDATAGFGRDAFTLADLGCEVLLCERHPLMALLLEEALEAARASDAWLADNASRLRLVARDARALDAAQLEGIDVIYLDPMFRTPRRGLPSKDMQVLEQLTDEDDPLDTERLFAWALEQAVTRVVVKRPRKAPALGERRPGHVLTGRSVRFDVYPL